MGVAAQLVLLTHWPNITRCNGSPVLHLAMPWVACFVHISFERALRPVGTGVQKHVM